MDISSRLSGVQKPRHMGFSSVFWLGSKSQMVAIVHPLLALLASLSRQELARQVAYLLAENRILRSKLPNRINLSNRERRRLVRHGKKLGPRIRDLISIVSYSTFRKWIRELEKIEPTREKSKAKNGRPRIEESLSDLIIRMRTESGWGYSKIVQELRRLGHKVSRQTVRNVLRQAGLGPDPQDEQPDSWSQFLKRHAETLWQCDFACKRKWTVKGLVDVYFLVFIHLGTRRIWISPCTEHPHAHWTMQQGRNFLMHVEDQNLKCKYLACFSQQARYQHEILVQDPTKLELNDLQKAPHPTRILYRKHL